MWIARGITEVIVVIAATILFDRWVSTKAAVTVLCVGIVLLVAFNWAELTVLHKKVSAFAEVNKWGVTAICVGLGAAIGLAIGIALIYSPKANKPTGQADEGKQPTSVSVLIGYQPFQGAYNEKLGQIRGEIEIVGHVSYDVYKESNVAWLESLQSGTHFIFSHKSEKWIEQKSTRIPSRAEDNGKYYDLESRRRVFKNCPNGMEPPTGEIMLLWEENPKYWKDLLGWRYWGAISQNTVRYLRFEHGHMLGPLPKYKYGGPPNHPGHPNAYVLVLFDDGTFDSPNTSEPSPKWEPY